VIVIATSTIHHSVDKVQGTFTFDHRM